MIARRSAAAVPPAPPRTELPGGLRVLLFFAVCVYLPVFHLLVGAMLPARVPWVRFGTALAAEWSLFGFVFLLLQAERLGPAEIGWSGERLPRETGLGFVLMGCFWVAVWAGLTALDAAGQTVQLPCGFSCPGVPRFFPGGAPGGLQSVVAAVTAGVCEETVFRGYLLHRGANLLAGRAAGLLFALFFSSLFFGLLHWPAGGGRLLAVSAFGGFCCSLLVLWRGRLTSAIVVHVLFNLQGWYVSW